MNTQSIAGAARVICEALGRPSAVPATIAVALDAGGWLNLAETAAELRTLRARVAELETAAAKTSEFCAQRAEYVTNLRGCIDADGTYYRWTGEAAARRELSQLLGLPVGWPAEDLPVIAALAVVPVEDPHDSPLHRDYRLGHDLPETSR